MKDDDVLPNRPTRVMRRKGSGVPVDDCEQGTGPSNRGPTDVLEAPASGEHEDPVTLDESTGRAQARSGWPKVAVVGVILIALVLFLEGDHLVAFVHPEAQVVASEPDRPATQYVRIANTDGAGAYLHRTPRRGDRAVAYPEGARFESMGDEIVGDEGWTWRHVRAPDGAIGWVPAQFTASADAEPTSDGASAAGGATWVVANTDGEGVFICLTPHRGDVIAAYPEGTLLERIGEASAGAEGWTWRRVRTPDGVIGWVPAQFTIDAR